MKCCVGYTAVLDNLTEPICLSSTRLGDHTRTDYLHDPEA